jgi:hypothetical protein
MFVTEGRSNYDAVLKGLIPRVDKARTSVSFFGETCTVRDEGVYRKEERLDTMGSILVIRYLLHGGNGPNQGIWTPYRDLKDGAQFSAYIKANIEDKLALTFAGRRGLLEERLRFLGARSKDVGVRADLSMTIDAFPHLSVLALFHDRDEEFPASFQFLFDASALSYLDLESLAVLLEYIYLKMTGGA